MAQNPWVDAQTARLKAAKAGQLQSTEKLGLAIRDGREKRARDRRAEWQAKPKEAQQKQVAGLLASHDKQVATARAKRENVQHVVEIPVFNGGRRALGRPIGIESFSYEYPDCPRCQGHRIKRAGWAHGVQRYRCLECGRSFAPDYNNELREKPYHLTCYRCGGTGVPHAFKRYKGRRFELGGVVGMCPHCGKRFIQGGPRHLEMSMCLLLARVDAEVDARANPLLHAEVLQQAALDVLKGLAYVWNVPLDLAAARRNISDESREPAWFRAQEKGGNA